MVLKEARAGQSGTHVDPPLEGVNARPEPLLLTKSEAAEMLNVSLRTLSRMIAAGSLPTVRITGSPRIRRADVERLVGTEGRK